MNHYYSGNNLLKVVKSEILYHAYMFSHIPSDIVPQKINQELSALSSSNHPFSGATVDGQNPAPVDMVNIPLFVSFIHLRWLAGFLNQ